VCLGVTAIVLFALFHNVDMKPKVDEHFFFSRQDPQLRADNQILRLFPEPTQLILAVPGDIRSMSYLQRITDLTDALANVPGVASVESLSRGPKDIDDALKSRLWTRLLLAENRKASYIYLILKKNAGEGTIRKVEVVTEKFDRPTSSVMISGVPYVSELIARSLERDLRIFSLSAVCIFGVVLFVIFRSPWILLGTFAACADSSACTLIATHLLHIPIGPLTANLSTIVFVMTLSPIVFLPLTGNGFVKSEMLKAALLCGMP